MTHHRLSVLLRHVDTRFIALNLVFLAFVVFLPFPAEIVGLYGGTTTAAVFEEVTVNESVWNCRARKARTADSIK